MILILDLGTTLGWVVSVTLPPRFTPGKDPWYPLHRRLGGPQSWSGHRDWSKNPFPLPVIEPRSSSLHSFSSGGDRTPVVQSAFIFLWR
jgi:hypothetical protein